MHDDDHSRDRARTTRRSARTKWRETVTARAALRLAREHGEITATLPQALTPMPLGEGEDKALTALGRLRHDQAGLAATLTRYRFHLAAADLGLSIDPLVVDGLVVAISALAALGAIHPAIDRAAWLAKLDLARAHVDHGNDHLAVVLAVCIELDALTLGLDPTDPGA